MTKLKVFEAFSGYGSQSIALRNIGIDYEVVAISEINKYSISAYKAIHGDVLNLEDISKINIEDIPQHDLFTYSFPCQDISLAGVMKGLERGKTRSGLLYECEKIIEYCKPKYLLLENVKNLVGKKFKSDFDNWLKYLESLGYTNYWKVLNAKDFGIPQNRERVFVISVLGEHKPFSFPEEIPLTKCINDILEQNVSSKYYLKDEFCFQNYSSFDIESIKDSFTEKNLQSKIIEYKISQYVSVRKYEVDTEKLKLVLKTHKAKSKLSIKDISTKLNVTKTTVEHWFRNDNCFSIPDKDIWLELKNLLNIKTNEFDKPIMEFETKPNMYDMSNRVYGIYGISPTLTCAGDSSAKKILESPGKIRKLTSTEYFRLMGMNDSDIKKIQEANISTSQQYKMAGNSIVVPILEEIFKNLLLN